MLLSIAMMVKNEEKNLENCLKSLRPILENIESELIVVDTGSTDKTLEIAKKFTDKVYFHKWNNDFSEMRNITINYAIGKWVFIIDGDEVMDDTNEIISFFNSGEYKQFKSAMITGINYTNLETKAYNTLDTIRFFYKDKDLRYEGAVHNQAIYKTPVKKLNCTFKHYGYVNSDKELMDRKFTRTTEILKKELEKNPDNIYYLFQLSKSYLMHGDIKKALDESYKAYEKLNNKNQIQYKYVYINHAYTLCMNGIYSEAEQVCRNGIDIVRDNDDHNQYKIDLFYYMGKSQMLQKKYDQAIKAFNNYIILMNKYESGDIKSDISIINQTICNKQEVLCDLSRLYYLEKDYKCALNSAKKITEVKYSERIIDVIVECFLNLRQYNELRDYYYELCENNSLMLIRFFSLLENIKLDLEDCEVLILEEVFSGNRNVYEILNLIRYNYRNDKKVIHNNLDNILSIINNNQQEDYFGDLLYLGIKTGYEISQIVEKMQYKNISNQLDYCNKKYSDLIPVLYEYIVINNIDNKKFKQEKCFKLLCQYLLLSKKLKDDEYRIILEIYINSGFKFIKYVYSEYIIENEMINEARNIDDAFLILLLKADRIKKRDKKSYIQYLSRAVKIFPAMKKGIKIIANEFEEKFNKTDMEMKLLKERFITNIEILIKSNALEDAEKLIIQYESLMGMDLEILLLKSQILLDEKAKYLN